MVTRVAHGFETNKQTNKQQIINFLDEKNMLAYIFKLVKRNKTYNKLNINFGNLFYCQLTV